MPALANSWVRYLASPRQPHDEVRDLACRYKSCGEYYLSSEVAGQVMDKAEAAVSSGAEVEIVKFAA